MTLLICHPLLSELFDYIFVLKYSRGGCRDCSHYPSRYTINSDACLLQRVLIAYQKFCSAENKNKHCSLIFRFPRIDFWSKQCHSTLGRTLFNPQKNNVDLFREVHAHEVHTLCILCKGFFNCACDLCVCVCMC